MSQNSLALEILSWKITNSDKERHAESTTTENVIDKNTDTALTLIVQGLLGTNISPSIPEDSKHPHRILQEKVHILVGQTSLTYLVSVPQP